MKIDLRKLDSRVSPYREKRYILEDRSNRQRNRETSCLGTSRLHLRDISDFFAHIFPCIDPFLSLSSLFFYFFFSFSLLLQPASSNRIVEILILRVTRIYVTYGGERLNARICAIKARKTGYGGFDAGRNTGTATVARPMKTGRRPLATATRGRTTRLPRLLAFAGRATRQRLCRLFIVFARVPNGRKVA